MAQVGDIQCCQMPDYRRRDLYNDSHLATQVIWHEYDINSEQSLGHSQK